MIKKFFMLICLCGLVGTSCRDASKKHVNPTEDVIDVVELTNHPSFVSDMEQAHNKAQLLRNGIVCFNLEMTFGTRKSSMKIFTTPTSSSIRVDKHDGPSTVMIDGELYTDADSSQWKREQFGIYTYQYFFMAPYKFSDEGTIWQKLSDMKLEGKNTNRAKLTFESGTGDAPDDWYLVHSNPENNRVEYIGYIVTGGGASVEDAEKNARVIKYSDYQMVDGIPVAYKWEFFDYSPEHGLGDKRGEGILRNVEMMDVVDQFEIINDGTYQRITS